MPVATTDLGLTVCRAVLRDMPDKPVAIAPPTGMPGESTPAARIAGQWTAILTVNPDRVTVSARLKYWGLGLWDLAVLSPGAGQFDRYIFVMYPDPAEITGTVYEARLREAVERAVTAVEEDWDRVRAAAAGQETCPGGC